MSKAPSRITQELRRRIPKTTAFSLDRDTLRRLDAFAHAAHVSRSKAAEYILNDFFSTKDEEKLLEEK